MANRLLDGTRSRDARKPTLNVNDEVPTLKASAVRLTAVRCATARRLDSSPDCLRKAAKIVRGGGPRCEVAATGAHIHRRDGPPRRQGVADIRYAGPPIPGRAPWRERQVEVEWSRLARV
jgi:hypothetical protein